MEHRPETVNLARLLYVLDKASSVADVCKIPRAGNHVAVLSSATETILLVPRSIPITTGAAIPDIASCALLLLDETA